MMRARAGVPNVASMWTDESALPILAAFAAGAPRREAIDFAVVASRITGAPLVAVTVQQSGAMADALGAAVEDVPGEGGRAIEHLRLELSQRGLRRPDIRVVKARRVGAGLVKAMEDLHPSLVVIGSPAHRGASGALLGDDTQTVIHATACPVAVVPHGYHARQGDVRMVGAAFTPTDEGRVALQTAGALARAASATLRVVEARPGQAGSEPSGELREALTALGDSLQVEARVADDPLRALLAASQEVDMLVVGSQARGPRRAIALGSVSRRLAERAACPVLIVPRDAAGAASALLTYAEPQAAT
jgi:nucleotide-binding universal stress UspA family protein